MTQIPHIQEVLKLAAILGHAFLVQQFIPLPGHALELTGHLRHIFWDGGQHHGSGQVKLSISQQQAQTAKSTRVRWDQNLFHPQFLGNLAGVEGAGSAEGHQTEFPHVIALLHRDAADGAHHVGVDHGDDAVGRLLEVQIGFIADLVLDGLLGQLDIHIHTAAQDLLLIQLAQDDVGVGDTGILTAPHVAGGAGGGACALGAHFQGAALIDFGNGTAAGADRDNVDHGDAGGISLHLPLVGYLGSEILNEGDVRAGAAHVKGDDFVRAALTADKGGGDDAGRGPGHGGLDGAVHRLLDGDNGAVGLGDIGFHPDTNALHGIPEIIYVLFHHRAQVAVEHGGAHAAVLPELGYQLAGDGDIGLWKFFLDDLLDTQLMDGVDKGKQGAHRNGSDLLFLQVAHHLPSLLLVQRGVDGSVIPDALRHSAVEAGGNQREGLLRLKVIQGGAALVTDLHQILKALGGDQAHAGALFFNQGVGSHCGAMGQIADGGRLRLFDCQYRQNSLDNGPGGIRGGRAVLVVEQLSALLVKNGEVCKGSADVHADHIRHVYSPHFEFLSTLRGVWSNTCD